MSLDAQKFVMMIKQAAVEAVNANEPMSLKIGDVVSTTPLKISLNQKITIPATQLLLTNAVRDYTVYATVDHAADDATYPSNTENAEAASSGQGLADENRKKFTFHLRLKVGEKVLLLRCDGGQKFIVLDRLGAPNG